MEFRLNCLRCGNRNRDTSLSYLQLLDIMSTQTALYIARLGMQSRLDGREIYGGVGEKSRPMI